MGAEPVDRLGVVARRARVSRMTVSRVFSARAPVAAVTRQRVLRAADALGYRPNILLRTMRGQRTLSAGFIWSFWDPFTPDGEIGSALMGRLQQRGFATYQAQYCNDPVFMARAVEDFVQRRVDAVIIEGTRAQLRAPEPLRWLSRIPAVVAVTPSAARGFPGDQIIHDRNSGVGEVVAYLAATGRRRPVMATDLREETNRMKFRHFTACCRRHGIAHDALCLPFHGSQGTRDRVDGFRRDFSRALHAGLRLDALFVFNDLAAMCALRELRQAGRQVPDDVAVIGFGNDQACTLWDPPLASGDRRPDEVVDCAERLLIERLAAPGRPARREHVGMRFVWRESAGPVLPPPKPATNVLSDK